MDCISIIIPYFKKRNFIKDTLRSVYSQSYKNFEVIIVYDQKDSGDFNYIKHLINSDKRFKIINNKNNFGVSHSRNNGIQKAKGKYIAFLDADDLWKKNKLKLQYNFMKKKKLLFTHTSYAILNSKNNIVGKMIVKDKLNYNDLLKSCDIGLSTVMFDSKIKNQIHFPIIQTKEDYCLWLKISKTIPINGLNKILTYRKKTKNSLSSNLFENMKNGFLVYFKHEKKSFIKSLIYLIILSYYSVLKKLKQKIWRLN
jgi:teichuronic acid biosynthesis glycosyltransferase TuaG